MVGAGLWFALANDESDPYSAPTDGPVVSTFALPSYDWDGASAMEANISGILSFTPEGCTLMSLVEGESRHTQAVFFPNATGVTFDNGTRAVVDRHGDVFAIEGRAFAYAGGFVLAADSEMGRDWAAQCPGPGVRGGAVVNDEPATERVTTSPAGPDQALPTALPSDHELGYYAVPTFAWDPEQNRDTSRIEGRVNFTDEGCPVVDLGELESSVGLIFPNAEGHRSPQNPGRSTVQGSFPNGTSGTMAINGEKVSLGGGYRQADDERWTSVCRDAPVERTFQVFDPGFPVD